ncbi:MAG: NAD(P)H-binding protein [Crocinitomicaceae bacterium]|nr:NAD(P)H-binding protein [Crocinitomicaceae bacterium]NGF75075.1 NAD(P)H-binding protein [Fluviicola sp. SGL-29]
MKKVALIGATGFVGTQILHELVNRNVVVKAIARNTEKIEPSPLVEPVAVNINNEEELQQALSGVDAVISAYNAGWTNPNIYDDFLAGSKTIENAVKNAGVKRYIVIGGAGSLYIDEQTQLVDTPQFPAEIKAGALAARDYLTHLKGENDLEWTFFSPAIEMHQGTAGVRRGTYRTALENPVFDENNRSILSVEDVAVVIADELEHPKHIRQRFTAAY